MGALKVWDGTAWQTVGTSGSPGANVYVAPSAPPGTPNGGDLWYDTDEVSGLALPLTLVNGGTGGASAATARSSLAVPAIGNSAVTAGAPTTGTWARGDQWLDSNAVLWLCTVAGTPGTWVSKNQGEELAYNQITASVTLASNTVASPNLVIEGTTRSYDGGMLMIEVSAIVGCSTSAGAASFLQLWDGSTDLGAICEVYNGASTVNYGVTVLGKRRLTPTVGTHNYRIQGWSNIGVGNVYTSPGGAGLNQMPAFIRVTRA